MKTGAKQTRSFTLRRDGLTIHPCRASTIYRDERTVQEIMMAFEQYAIEEIHETLERYKFGERQQQEGESMDKFLADLRIVMKTSPRCESSILRDRIILGIRSNDIREYLLNPR